MNPRDITAVVLAAGVGSRLQSSTRRPKTLLNVGETSLLRRIALQCAHLGLEKMIVVTGHRRDTVEAHLQEAPFPLEVQTVFNDEYDTANNALSLLATRAVLETPWLIKFDGDLILHTEILAALVASPHESVIALDSTRALCEEDMKANVAADGRVTAFGKPLPLDASGVSIGVERLGPSELSIVFDTIDDMVHRRGERDIYYEDAYDFALDSLDLWSVDTMGHPWTEIDTAEDLAYAHQLVERLDTLDH